MALSASKEWAPIKFGSIPWNWRFIYSASTLTAATIFEIWTDVHCLLSNIFHMRLDAYPQLLSMWCNWRSRVATAPFGLVVSWWRVWPMRLFFLLYIFKVTTSSWEIILNFEFREIILPSFKNPMSITLIFLYLLHAPSSHFVVPYLSWCILHFSGGSKIPRL